MRWFERYGIVGAYFFVITICWITAWSYFTIQQQKIVNYVIGFGASALPIGYLLTVASQFLFYTRGGGKQIHREVVKIVFSTFGEKRAEKLGLSETDDEATCESKLTAILRLEKVKGISLDNLQYLAVFVTSRFDVLAVNNSIILTSIVAFVFAPAVIIIGPIFTFKPNPSFLLAVFGVSLIIMTVLKSSNEVLSKQILEIHRTVYDSLLNTPSNPCNDRS